MANSLMKISDIKANPNNPRIIKDDKFKKLVESVKSFPEMLELRPIVVNKDMIILGGNMRYKACKEAWIKEIPVIIADNLTEEQEREFLIKDNVSGGEWDWDILANEWDKEELEEWGLDVTFDTVEPTAEEDDFEVDESIKTDIVLWDLFEIGEHRLLCWDSTNIDDVNKLMNGEKADWVWTDPPYNIWFKPQRWTHDKIMNDNMSDEEFETFLWDYLSNQFSFTKDNTVAIIWMWWPTIQSFQKKIKELYTIKSMPIWYKNNFWIWYWTRPQYEPCFLCLKWEPEKPETAPSDIWEYSKVYKTIHSCEKPIELIWEKIKTFIKWNLILDLFWWSGSTMVACHQLNRKCFMSELDPKYVQTIVNRMQKLDPSLVIKRNWVAYNNSDVTVK